MIIRNRLPNILDKANVIKKVEYNEQSRQCLYLAINRTTHKSSPGRRLNIADLNDVGDLRELCLKMGRTPAALKEEKID